MIDKLKKIFKTLTRSLEVLYVLNDLKQAARLDAAEDELPGIIEFCNSVGLFIKKSDFKIIKQIDADKGFFSNKGIRVNSDFKGAGAVHLYISKSDALAEQAKAFESEQKDDGLGKLLGYPECCIDFFIKNKPFQQKKENDYVLPALENSHGFVFPFYNNIALKCFDAALLSHFPCNFNCKESVEIAQRNLECIKKCSEEYSNKIMELLKSAVLYTEKDGVFILRNHNLEGNIVYYDKLIASSAGYIYDILRRNNQLAIHNKNQLLVGKEELRGAGLIIFI